MSPNGIRADFRLAHGAGFAKGGIAVGSLHTYTGEDAEARNADLLNLVARLATYRC